MFTCAAGGLGKPTQWHFIPTEILFSYAVTEFSKVGKRPKTKERLVYKLYKYGSCSYINMVETERQTETDKQTGRERERERERENLLQDPTLLPAAGHRKRRHPFCRESCAINSSPPPPPGLCQSSFVCYICCKGICFSHLFPSLGNIMSLQSSLYTVKCKCLTRAIYESSV